MQPSRREPCAWSCDARASHALGVATHERAMRLELRRTSEPCAWSCDARASHALGVATHERAQALWTHTSRRGLSREEEPSLSPTYSVSSQKLCTTTRLFSTNNTSHCSRLPRVC
jgi:hypothetical protein